jgi:L-fucose mutarotase
VEFAVLIGIDPLLGGDLLKILDEMGHGDQLALVDRNYPAFAAGRPVVRLGAVTVLRAATAILSVFPLDDFVEYPVERMVPDDGSELSSSTHQAMLELARGAAHRRLACGDVRRMRFYERAKGTAAVIQTLDDQPYACFFFHKGVI